MILFPLFVTGVVDTGGKLTASVVYGVGKFATGVVDAASLSMVHLYLRKKFNDHNVIFRGLGEDDS